jgi:hypothetical protein
MATEQQLAPKKVSDELEHWLRGDQPKTLGSLIDVFGERSFAIVFVLLMAVPALPLPTGGVTHVFEVITMLLALELIVGRRTIWLPVRWRKLQIGGESKEKFIDALLRRIRSLERISRPRGQWLFGHRLSGSLFGPGHVAVDRPRRARARLPDDRHRRRRRRRLDRRARRGLGDLPRKHRREILQEHFLILN